MRPPGRDGRAVSAAGARSAASARCPAGAGRSPRACRINRPAAEKRPASLASSRWSCGARPGPRPARPSTPRSGTTFPPNSKRCWTTCRPSQPFNGNAEGARFAEMPLAGAVQCYIGIGGDQGHEGVPAGRAGPPVRAPRRVRPFARLAGRAKLLGEVLHSKLTFRLPVPCTVFPSRTNCVKMEYIKRIGRFGQPIVWR